MVNLRNDSLKQEASLASQLQDTKDKLSSTEAHYLATIANLKVVGAVICMDFLNASVRLLTVNL